MADGTTPQQGKRYTTADLDKLPTGALIISGTMTVRKTAAGLWNDGKQDYKSTSFTMTSLTFAHEIISAVEAKIDAHIRKTMPEVANVAEVARAATEVLRKATKPVKGKGKKEKPQPSTMDKNPTPEAIAFAARVTVPATPVPQGRWVAPDKPYVMPVESEVDKALRMFPSSSFPLDDIRRFIDHLDRMPWRDTSDRAVDIAKALSAMRFLLAEAEEVDTLRGTVADLEQLTDDQHKKAEELEGERKDDEDKHDEYVKDLIQQHKDYVDDLTNDHEVEVANMRGKIDALEDKVEELTDKLAEKA